MLSRGIGMPDAKPLTPEQWREHADNLRLEEEKLSIVLDYTLWESMLVARSAAEVFGGDGISDERLREIVRMIQDNLTMAKCRQTEFKAIYDVLKAQPLYAAPEAKDAEG